MSAKRRGKKMQRQRRLADRGPRPPASDDRPELDDLDDIDDLDDPSFIFHYDPVTGAASAVSGLFAGGLPFSKMMGHIMHHGGLAVEQLPPGALTEMLMDNACSTVAKNEAASLGDGCEAWYRWPVGNGIFMELKLYRGQGQLLLPESLRSHAEVEAVIDELVIGHCLRQPQISRAAREQGAEAALALIDAIPIHLFLIED